MDRGRPARASRACSRCGKLSGDSFHETGTRRPARSDSAASKTSFQQPRARIHEQHRPNLARAFHRSRVHFFQSLRSRTSESPEPSGRAAQKNHRCRHHIPRPLGRAASRRLPQRQQSRFADRWLGTHARRPFRSRFCKVPERPDHRARRLPASRSGRRNIGAGRRLVRSRKCRRGSPMKPRLPIRQAILDRRTYEAPAEGRLGKIRLDFNENTAGCSPAVVRALAKITPQQFAMYPEYLEPAKRLARYFRVRPEELMLTNGGDDALRVFFDAFVDAGSHILICEPTFPMYRYYAEIFGARIEVERYGSEMEFPLAGICAALCKKPRVLFIANPNN